MRFEESATCVVVPDTCQIVGLESQGKGVERTVHHVVGQALRHISEAV
jgi:hypothetical protein